MAHISHLSLTNFRNFRQLELSLPRGVTVFFGDNAQGKTTLMEAVYLLAIARSFRADNEREVVNFEAATHGEQALVGGTIEKQNERLSVYVGYQSVANPPATEGSGAANPSLGYSVRKQIRVSRVRRTATELVGMVGAALFSADDIELVYGPPSGRRRYLDILLSQCDPIYLKALQRYQKVVQQRNRLLRTLREGKAGEDELAFWDDELAREGAWLTCRRGESLALLSRLCAEHHHELGGPREDLVVAYAPSVPPGDSTEETEGLLRKALAAVLRRERATAATVVGPHRDDFTMTSRGMDMTTFASRGEARTLALTLRLAEAAYLETARGEQPIVLLDDVLSEMDADRRRRVLERAARYEQVMITTTDRGAAEGFFEKNAAYFRVEDGGVYPEE